MSQDSARHCSSSVSSVWNSHSTRHSFGSSPQTWEAGILWITSSIWVSFTRRVRRSCWGTPWKLGPDPDPHSRPSEIENYGQKWFDKNQTSFWAQFDIYASEPNIRENCWWYNGSWWNSDFQGRLQEMMIFSNCWSFSKWLWNDQKMVRGRSNAVLEWKLDDKIKFIQHSTSLSGGSLVVS